MKSTFRAVGGLIATFVWCAPAALALTADQIALVVNRNQPQSAELAGFYTQARKIPLDRIIELDLPTTEETPFDRYERSVTPPVRHFLRSRGLEKQIRCLVTFYGVPIRISDRANSPLDLAELAMLKHHSQQVMARLEQMVQEVEREARQLDAAFRPASTQTSFEALMQRLDRAGKAINSAAARATDPAVKQQVATFAAETMARFKAAVDMPEPPMPSTSPATSSQPAEPMEQLATQSFEEASLLDLIEQPFDAAARRELRRRARANEGIAAYARVLLDQIDYLTTDATGSAFDSELALLWWPAYSRVRWRPNMLYLTNRGMSAPPPIMVMRLDAPQPQIVRDIIAGSITAEREGLIGKAVIDARGISPKSENDKEDALGVFDQRLRDVATLIHVQTRLKVSLDNKPEVLPPDSHDRVALYCGWYSVRAYVPAMRFNPGAVGYHVASFEMITLHNPAETGWVSGLLNAGVAGTLGPVAEPYLFAFPPPDEFFPLLLTGKMSLGEVYWATTPLTSWMMCCIGDPLYNPYASRPALAVEKLPPRLQQALRPAVSGP